MPNIASILKAEISRVARKEVRSELAVLKKTAAACRSDIAALKRRAQALEQQLRKLGKTVTKTPPNAADEPSQRASRFSAKGLTAQRQRLALSANDCGLLIGTSGQSVYNWESGKTRPRATHLAAIAGLRSMGKKEVAAKLAAMRPAPRRG